MTRERLRVRLVERSIARSTLSSIVTDVLTRILHNIPPSAERLLRPIVVTHSASVESSDATDVDCATRLKGALVSVRARFP